MINRNYRQKEQQSELSSRLAMADLKAFKVGSVLVVSESEFHNLLRLTY